MTRAAPPSDWRRVLEQVKPVSSRCFPDSKGCMSTAFAYAAPFSRPNAWATTEALQINPHFRLGDWSSSVIYLRLQGPGPRLAEGHPAAGPRAQDPRGGRAQARHLEAPLVCVDSVYLAAQQAPLVHSQSRHLRPQRVVMRMLAGRLAGYLRQVPSSSAARPPRRDSMATWASRQRYARSAQPR